MKTQKSYSLKIARWNRTLILAGIIVSFGVICPRSIYAWVWPWEAQEQIEQAQAAQVDSEWRAERAERDADQAAGQARRIQLVALVAGLLGAGVIVYLIKTRTIVKTEVRNEVVQNVVREEVIVRSPAHELAPDKVVIDATNVIYGSSSVQIPSLLNLLGLLLELQNRKCAFKCFFDACTFYKLKENIWDEGAAFATLCRDYPDVFVQVPGGTQADDFILDYAHSHGTPIISNDRYRDYVEKYSWLETDAKRRISFAVHSGNIQIVPLGIEAAIPVSLADAESRLRNSLGMPTAPKPKCARKSAPISPRLNGSIKLATA